MCFFRSELSCAFLSRACRLIFLQVIVDHAGQLELLRTLANPVFGHDDVKMGE
jgi:hypothetical protein